ncbi:hypothetical protein V8C26DRAFT_395413 [Trichoderma gracile]
MSSYLQISLLFPLSKRPSPQPSTKILSNTPPGHSFLPFSNDLPTSSSHLEQPHKNHQTLSKQPSCRLRASTSNHSSNHPANANSLVEPSQAPRYRDHASPNQTSLLLLLLLLQPSSLYQGKQQQQQQHQLSPHPAPKQHPQPTIPNPQSRSLHLHPKNAHKTNTQSKKLSALKNNKASLPRMGILQKALPRQQRPLRIHPHPHKKKTSTGPSTKHPSPTQYSVFTNTSSPYTTPSSSSSSPHSSQFPPSTPTPKTPKTTPVSKLLSRNPHAYNTPNVQPPRSTAFNRNSHSLHPRPGQTPVAQSPYYFLVHLPEDGTASSPSLQQQEEQSPLTPNHLVSPYSLYRP